MTSMGSPRRVAVAMSGGVDSSAAAALLLERGYSVSGLTMHLWRETESPAAEDSAIRSARSVCEHLGIRHHTIDLRQAFRRKVVDRFIREYSCARTPNPCVVCNRSLKFGLLLDAARELGYDVLATGHYARIEGDLDGYHLLCGLDARKDQSYFLHSLGQAQLASLCFPLGDWTKGRVREYARQKGLPTSERPESQDICFLADGDYRRFLRQYAPEAIRSGRILDSHGRVLGEHEGLPFYTIGQRGGLGISAPRPLYVLALDLSRNAVVVGHADELGRRALLAEEMSYISGHAPATGTSVEAKIRYRARRVPATVEVLGEGGASVLFGRELRDITPGQAVVLYVGEQVIGGGIISRACAGADYSPI